MSTLAIEGMQWGDEGKGKITDYFASMSDIVVRSQGGNNAGHSVVHKNKRYALRLLPSGILRENVINVIAEGVVVNPFALLDEIKSLEEAGIKHFNLLISNRAILLLPYHVALDKARESLLAKNKIGTTGRGIGPCYEDRASRNALRVGDLLSPTYLKERLENALIIKNKELSAYDIPPFEFEPLYKELLALGDTLKPYITDTGYFLSEAIKEGKKVLFEGAQGAMLSLSSGTYPFVTSSSPLATAIPVNTSLPLDSVNNVLGIMKAYTTRVGAGPFPSEISDEELANKIRIRGHEFGVVTGRPRRVGWFDAALMRYVARISGIKQVAIMLLDVLDCVDEIKVLTDYKINGKIYPSFPSTIEDVEKIEPVYTSFPSWKEDISGIKKFSDLPLNAQNYVKALEKMLGVEAVLISVGPEEKQTIVRKEIF